MNEAKNPQAIPTYGRTTEYDWDKRWTKEALQKAFSPVYERKKATRINANPGGLLEAPLQDANVPLQRCDQRAVSDAPSWSVTSQSDLG